MLQEINKELTKHIIPFWKSLRDEEYGGYYGLVDFDLTVDKKAEKGAILNSRILWFFSRAFNELKDISLLREADHAYRFLEEKLLDEEKGGICWSVTYDGKVLDSTRHTYNQAFAIYALSEYYRASGNKTALITAQKLFCLIEDKCRDRDGYLEAFDEDFNPLPNDKLSENGVIAERTMNTALHVLEAYTLLFDVTDDLSVKKLIGIKLAQLLGVIRTKIYNPDKKRLDVFFDRDYESLIDLQSYGHDIEASWLIDLAADTLGDAFLEKEAAANIKRMTGELAESTFERALQDGSFINECEDGKQDRTRIWWVQSEAMVGFANAYRKTGQARYLKAVSDIWEYTGEFIIDKRNGGEWFWQASEDGAPGKRPIVEPWKCPYHNGRMCFEIMNRLKEGEADDSRKVLRGA
ncbi:AGE family epimerase/isomerase [Butyrivibrio sp. FCS014]|uniref:AGE family epimerase/isomerase n=1 Tax=Butyrivibrio sp. FCS014 TaxID=1408304 RepID=UPI0004630B11|nr:AGE family epimerase/isomerase [Butyrivibrio sp. FCS014]